MLNRICLYWLRTTSLLALFVSFISIPEALHAEDHSEKLDSFLMKGKLQESIEHFSKIPGDNQAIVCLGITQFLQAIEGLAHDGYRYGLRNHLGVMIPIARIPVPLNPSPEAIGYEQVHQILQRFQTRLSVAEQTLAKVDTSDVLVKLYIGRVRMDINSDGNHSEEETLWEIFAKINTGIDKDAIKVHGSNFIVGVDGADVHWMRGYCHVLMGIIDIVLAYDERELFERCGQLLFKKIETPYRLDVNSKDEAYSQDFVTHIMDVVAAIHLVQFELKDADRMASAHEHFLQMIRQSRLCWERALSETDNYREWLPNPNQDSVLQMGVDDQIITSWHAVLDELEMVLEGKKLVPNWRHPVMIRSAINRGDFPEKGSGINLKRVFSEPRDFDLILTVQGSNMIPYVEEGPLSTPQVWETMTQAFQGQFFGFAIWFN